jgi:hypothetical protein
MAFHEGDGKPTQGCIPSRTGAEDPTTDDNNVELLVC